jgi:hypothetical protein
MNNEGMLDTIFSLKEFSEVSDEKKSLIRYVVDCAVSYAVLYKLTEQVTILFITFLVAYVGAGDMTLEEAFNRCGMAEENRKHLQSILCSAKIREQRLLNYN